MPSFLRGLKVLSKNFKMRPVLVEEDFIKAIFSVPYTQQVVQFHVYEAMSNSKTTLFVHAFVKDKQFRMNCWCAVAVSNQNGRIVFMPEGQWRENFNSFISDVGGMIATAKGESDADDFGF